MRDIVAVTPPALVSRPWPLTIAIFALAFLLPAFPWLSGAVTIPWDAKSQFYPPVQFLTTAIARGEWPWWTPNVFAGWPLIADPQSLLFSPLHVLLAAAAPAVGLRAFDAVTFAYLFLGGLGVLLFFRDRGWHPGGAMVAAMAFAFGGAASARIQHTIELVSLCWLPLALWLVARALERPSWRAGLAAGLVCGLLALGRDQVALLSLYVVAGFVLAYWMNGERPLEHVPQKSLPSGLTRGWEPVLRKRTCSNNAIERDDDSSSRSIVQATTPCAASASISPCA